MWDRYDDGSDVLLENAAATSENLGQSQLPVSAHVNRPANDDVACTEPVR